MKILFKLTTRKRPEKAQRTIDSIRENVTGTNHYISLSVDSDDDSWKQIKGYDILTISPPSNKIMAINSGVLFDFDILVNVSDDQVFIKKGFDEIIRNEFFCVEQEHDGFDVGSYYLDQFLHFPDGNREDLCTMSIIGRDYYDRDKYIYHPDYITECCDDEAQEVAKIRGCYKFVNEHIFNHEHPAYGKGSMDESYANNLTMEKRMKDRETLERRRAINFGL